MVRVPRAYPIYDSGYERRLRSLRGWLDGLDGLVQVGRNGLHRYNNSDHSMLTAMRAVENLCDGRGHDIWAVNADDAYLEEGELAEPPYRDAPETPAMARPLAAEVMARRRPRRPTTPPAVRSASQRASIARVAGSGSSSATIAVPPGGAVRKREWIAEIGRSRRQASAVSLRKSVEVTGAQPTMRPAPTLATRASRPIDPIAVLGRASASSPGISEARTAPCTPSAASSRPGERDRGRAPRVGHRRIASSTRATPTPPSTQATAAAGAANRGRPA